MVSERVVAFKVVEMNWSQVTNVFANLTITLIHALPAKNYRSPGKCL